MESNAVQNEHEFVRPDEPTKIPSNSKSPLSSLATSFRYIPEDSCDSVVSIDDVDDDEDEDDPTDTTGKSLNKLCQGPSPGNEWCPLSAKCILSHSTVYPLMFAGGLIICDVSVSPLDRTLLGYTEDLVQIMVAH